MVGLSLGVSMCCCALNNSNMFVLCFEVASGPLYWYGLPLEMVLGHFNLGQVINSFVVSNTYSSILLKIAFYSWSF